MEGKNKVKGLYISGRAITTVVQLLGKDKTEAITILKQYKLSDNMSIGEFQVNPDEWYDLDRYLEALLEIQSRFSAERLREIARSTILYAPLHPSITDIQSSLRGLNRAYYLNLSKDGLKPIFEESGKYSKEAGEYLIEVIPNIKKMICTSTSFFPTLYEVGLIEGFSRKFQPSAICKIDDTKPSKLKNAPSTTYIITW